VRENQQVFDVISLIRNENLDTKPNFAKFLETYVHDIRLGISGKIQFFPCLKYNANRVFVSFLDGHELIYYLKVDYPNQRRYYMEYNIDEVELKPKEMELVKEFFDNLIKFKFIHLTED
jgi:hypothetical protein